MLTLLCPEWMLDRSVVEKLQGNAHYKLEQKRQKSEIKLVENLEDFHKMSQFVRITVKDGRVEHLVGS